MPQHHHVAPAAPLQNTKKNKYMIVRSLKEILCFIQREEGFDRGGIQFFHSQIHSNKHLFKYKYDGWHLIVKIHRILLIGMNKIS